MKVVIEVDIDPGSVEWDDDDERERFEGSIADACGLPDMEDAIAEGISVGTGYIMQSVSITDVKSSNIARG